MAVSDRFQTGHYPIPGTPGRRLYIGLGGKAQHGKSTLANALTAHLQKLGLNVALTSFATVPKAMLATMGLTSAQLYGTEKQSPCLAIGGHTPRFAMQSLATEWGRRMLYDEVWVDAWERHCENLQETHVVIVDDLRHLTELKRLRHLRALTFEVYRPSLMPKTILGKIKHFWAQLHVHSSERLNFQHHGVKRLLVEEGDTEATLKKLLALVPHLQ